MATPKEAWRYANELVDARMQRRLDPDDITPDLNLAFLADTFESIPTQVLELLAQRDYRIAPVRPGERITEFDKPFADELSERGVIGEKLDAYLDRLAGVHLTGGDGTRRIYIALQENHILIHEIGHAVDTAIGGILSDDQRALEIPNSSIDPLINASYDKGAELLNEYAAVSPAEAFAEWFRAALDARDTYYDEAIVDVRADADLRAPVMMKYVDNLMESIGIALERDSLAFTDESELDRGLEVVIRSQVALMMNIPPRDVDMVQLEEMRAAFFRTGIDDLLHKPPQRDERMQLVGAPDHGGSDRESSGELELEL